MEEIDISKIKENPGNPRTISKAKFELLKKSIQEFPEMLKLRPLIIDKEGIVLGGNMRLRALRDLGYKKVPVIRAESLTEAQKKEFVIKDNASFGEWDMDALANEWSDLPLGDWGLDIPVIEAEVTEDDFKIPETIKTDIKLGDLFQIGNHRLLCGDSTKKEDVERLMVGKEPYLMVTDPPYGVNYDAGWRKKAGIKNCENNSEGKVTNDDKADWTETWLLSPCKVAYIWHSAKYTSEVQISLETSEFEIRCQIIWNKEQGVIGRGNYHWKHEPCWYAVKKGNKGNWAGDRKQTTVWDINKSNRKDTGHSTQKPIECMARPISNHDGDVYDPFLGSGTTMVASEQLNRKCYGIEISPEYCQVIIDRMKKAFPTIKVKKL